MYGSYQTLNSEAERNKAERTDLQTYLYNRDGEPSKNKIRWFLQIKMVVEMARELSPCHLQFIVVHEFMWTLVKEKASDQAHQTHVKYWDSDKDPMWIDRECQCVA